MRRTFFQELYKHMKKDKNIYALTGDLGYGGFDRIRDEFPDRFINCGAAEQAMMGMAVGLALKGKIPVVYSITTFLLYRPFETIRTYINHETIPVKMVGSGRDKDYAHDGISHWSEDAKAILEHFDNICTQWPETKEEIPELMENFLYCPAPHFLSLRR